MPVQRLTQTTVRALRPIKGKRTIYWNDDRSGLGVEVSAKGVKNFVLQYDDNGRARRMQIGPVGPLTVADAEKQATLKRAELIQGKDPAGQRQRDKLTLNDLFNDWDKSRTDADWKASTRKQYHSKYRNHLKPNLGQMTPWKIQKRHVTAIRNDMNALGMARTYNLSMAVFRQLMAWGWEQGYFPKAYTKDQLPIYGDAGKDLPTEDRDVVMEPAEMQLIMRAIDTLSSSDHDNDHGISVFAAAALKLLVYTGARHAEIVRARWDDLTVDDSSGQKIYLLTVGDHKTSRNRRTGKQRDKVIPLTGPCVDVIENLPRVDDNPHMFVGQVPGKSIKWLSWPWEVVCKYVGLVPGRAGYTIHDLRHCYVTYSLEAGATIEAVGAAVGHSSAYMTERYLKRRDEALRRAASHGAAAMASIIGQSEPDAAGNVVPLVRKAS